MEFFSKIIQEKIDLYIKLCKPDKVVVCDGSKEESERFLKLLVDQGSALPLKRENCFYFTSDPKDVARVESCTFICSENKKDAGPTNNWIEPKQMKQRLGKLFLGSMKGRVMYIIPYLMGDKDSPMCKAGIEITDSLYVCVNMYIMTRMGKIALPKIAEEDVVFGLHSVGYPLKEGQKDVPWPCNEEKVIAHFPETKEILSFGSGYGGNALLGKKCFALRIASVIAKREGWLAEHMLIVGITNPEGKKKYFAAAFPSSCGKTNLAMLFPKIPGWKVECVGDDIAWMKFYEDGRLYAINPENGFFGVAPGTSEKTNPSAMAIVEKDTLFTNVALNGDDVWWEGMSDKVPDALISWQGKKYDKNGSEPAAHPNSRFTSPLKRCPNLDRGDSVKGVPIEGIIFGGRRADLAPLVMEAKNWQMGVFYGASLSSEKTSAAEGVKGQMRQDPFAMLPFCGYNMADYFSHWLSMEKPGRKMPKIFSVNWFRKDVNGAYIWPGYSANLAVLGWMFDSIEEKVEKKETPFGFVPTSLNIDGINISKKSLDEILLLDEKGYEKEMERLTLYFKETFGETFPQKLSAFLHI
jgi:phosphoenolpyruvate carboxykinase (GTP)